MGGLSSPYPYPSAYRTPTNTLEYVSSYQIGYYNSIVKCSMSLFMGGDFGRLPYHMYILFLLYPNLYLDTHHKHIYIHSYPFGYGQVGVGCLL